MTMKIGIPFKLILTHPVTKRLALAAPFNFGIGLFCSWLLGVPSIPIGLLTGAITYLVADYLLSDEQSRQERKQQITALFCEHWRMIVQAWIGLVIFVFFYNFRVEPVEQAVKSLLTMVETFGLLVVFIVPVYVTSLGWRLMFAEIISGFFRGLAAYGLALCLISRGGDIGYRWILANPTDAAISLASTLIIWMIIQFGTGLRRYRPEHIARSFGVGTNAASFVTKLTTRDNRYTAAHEVGHVLVYAALEFLPPDVKLAINDRPDDKGVLGFVTGIVSQHQLEGKTFAEWRMLVFLAGRMGESVMFGESTLGSSNDHHNWTNIALSYLSNHSRGVFYVSPNNELEQQQNNVKLDALQQEQLAMLQTLFDLNIVVFKELADTLLNKRTMDVEDIAPFLASVKLPDGFPCPKELQPSSIGE